MANKLARGFQLIFWGLIFWFVDLNLTIYFSTDPTRINLFPNIAGIALIFLGSVIFVLRGRFFGGKFGKKYRIAVFVSLVTSFLWLVHNILNYMSAGGSWDRFTKVDLFWVENIFFLALVVLGFLVCKYFQLEAKIHWIILGVMMAVFYIGLFIFGLALRDMLYTDPPVIAILLALYSVYTLFALLKTKNALLQKS